MPAVGAYHYGMGARFMYYRVLSVRMHNDLGRSRFSGTDYYGMRTIGVHHNGLTICQACHGDKK